MTQVNDQSGRIGVYPPDEEPTAAAQAVQGLRITPGFVTALDGLEPGGPEAAGALTLLHTTFADNGGAQRGYRNFAAIKEDFRDRRGFLRWLTFNDGPHGYALGLWRTTDDVTAFLAGRAHQRMVREQRERPFEYNQFAGVWGLLQSWTQDAVLPTMQHRHGGPRPRV